MPQPAQFQSGPLFWLLVFAAAIGQGSLHIILPAISALSTDLGVSYAAAQASLTVAMVSIAISTVITGPISDIFGRRPVFIGGLVIFIAGTALAMVASNIETMLIARAVQGVGAVTGLIMGRAMMRDLYEGVQAAKGMSYLMIGQVIGPALAPILGASILIVFDWRAIFGFTLILGLMLCGLALRYLSETSPSERRAAGQFKAGLKALFVKLDFWLVVYVSGMTIAIFFSIISTGSWLIIDQSGLSPLWFVVLMAAFSLNFVASNFINTRLVTRRPILAIMRRGMQVNALSLILLIGMIFAKLPMAWLLIPCGLFAFSNGQVLPNTVATAIGMEPRAAGTASGLVVASQFLFAAVLSQILTLYLDIYGLVALAWVVIFGLVTASLAFRWLWIRNRGAQT